MRCRVCSCPEGWSLHHAGRNRLLCPARRRDWRVRHPARLTNRALSIRNAKVGNTGIFSRGVLCTFIVTNILSLLLGAGLG